MKNTKSYNLQSLNYLLKNNNLNLNPKYQREGVWSIYQKQLLIDSVLQDIDIPKLYFRDVTDPQKPTFELYEVVDGQQRLRAISDFINNQYPTFQESDKCLDIDVANMKFNELPTSVQQRLFNYQFDIVILINYSEEDVEEMFLRLQNGTPLNAAEKRRALNSNVRELVNDLAKHKLFNNYCAFTNKRFAFEDVSSKILHFHLNQKISEIKPNYIRDTYDFFKGIDISNKHFIESKKSLNFLENSFKQIKDNPKLKKGELLTLSFLVTELLSQYNLGDFKTEFAETFIKLETERQIDSEKDIEKQNPELIGLRDSLRSDSIQNLKYRHDFYKDYFLSKLIKLQQLDENRLFSDDQKSALFRIFNGKCEMCGTDCERNNFHADHKIAYKSGGKTNLENGQLLCVSCNLSKGSN